MKIIYAINAIGLLLDIIGVILLAKFGLPPDVRRDGVSFLILESVDQTEIDKGKRYDNYSRLALGFIFAGFIIQFGVSIYFMIGM